MKWEDLSVDGMLKDTAISGLSYSAEREQLDLHILSSPVPEATTIRFSGVRGFLTSGFCQSNLLDEVYWTNLDASSFSRFVQLAEAEFSGTAWNWAFSKTGLGINLNPFYGLEVSAIADSLRLLTRTAGVIWDLEGNFPENQLVGAGTND